MEKEAEEDEEYVVVEDKQKQRDRAPAIITPARTRADSLRLALGAHIHACTLRCTDDLIAVGSAQNSWCGERASWAARKPAHRAVRLR